MGPIAEELYNSSWQSHMVNTEHEQPIQVILRLLDCEIVTRGRVVIIGLGGTGAYLVRPLATFLASLHDARSGDPIELVLCDGDSFAAENSYRLDIVDFGNKAEVVGREIIERLASSLLTVRWVSQYVTQQNIAEIIQDGDCVLVACDNHATRKLVGRHCTSAMMRDIVLISGGNDGIEDNRAGTYGNVQVYVRKHGNDCTAPIERFHPEIANPADRTPDELSCLELAVAGAPQLLFANLAVASAMCNALLRLMMSRDDRPMYDEVALDVVQGVSAPLWISGAEFPTLH
jgi:hypothetical protein